jgi:hypothetical protein
MKRAPWFPCFALLALMVGLCASCAPVPPPPPDTTPKDPIPKGNGSPGVLPDVSTPDLLKQRIEAAIEQVNKRKLHWHHGFWTVFHAILGQGWKHTTLYDEAGKQVNAMEYVAKGGKMPGLLFVRDRDGIDVLSSKELTCLAQGHQDQFVAEMAQWGLPRDYPFVVDGKPCTFDDFIRFCKLRARITDKQELSWAILVIAQYEGTTGAWKNRHDEKVAFEDIVRYELNEPIEKAACGGTHRLFGLTWALHKHLQGGHKLEGVWKEVADKIERYKQRAKELRNSDGTFSTAFFEERGNVSDADRRINTTGHTIEWLALAMTDAELRAPWMQEAVNALTKLFFDHRKDSIEGGSLYHAVHGLLIYYARVYGPQRLGDQAPLVMLPRKK